MIFPDPDKLEKSGSRYGLVTLAAKRAKQIKNGAGPLIDTDSTNPLTIALEEIAAGKLTFQVPDFDHPTTSEEEQDFAGIFSLSSISNQKKEEAEKADSEDDWELDEEDEDDLADNETDTVAAVDEFVEDEEGGKRSSVISDIEDEEEDDVSDEDSDVPVDTLIDGEWDDEEDEEPSKDEE